MPGPDQNRAPFCLLADPASYVACNWDLSRDAAGRAYWAAFFQRHLPTILGLGMAAAESRGQDRKQVLARADACRAEFNAHFDAFGKNPPDGPTSILLLDVWRDQFLRKYGFNDCFIDLKNRENEKMLPLLPVVCRQLDALEGRPQLRAVIEGIFAGNIFDMGAEATAKAFLGNSPDFFATRASLPARPWRIDDFDDLADALENRVYRKAVFFIDNAGSDFLLGALPMIRWLARRGTPVALVANERPTLNDMTVHDVNQWWPRIVAAEPSLQDLPIERVSSGTGEPLIDLSAVSQELNAAACEADLLVIEGMGRAVESNLDARFTCDTLRIAMLKDDMVAARVGGKLYDVVCHFRRKEAMR